MASNLNKKDRKYKKDVAAKAINIVLEERDRWEDATVFVTEKVGFRMRQLIRTLRKNFWGVFDKPVDPATGKEKVWMPLAQKVVEDYVKNINMGQKDVGFRASNPSGYAFTDLTRARVRDELEKINFGEVMDESDRQLCIDGTFVWKTWKTYEKGKPKMNRRTVDLLNIYIDPTEENIQTAYRFTERGIFLPDQIAGMTGWLDTDDINGSQSINRNDGKKNTVINLTTAKFTDVWEMYGKIPKWMITGDQDADDANEEIDGHVVVSGLDSNDPRCHLIEENKNKDKLGNVLKPYEECRDGKITGRWYGLGKIERILALIEWLNITTNIRISRQMVAQLGLFKIKKGAGITPQMLQKLSVNGAIQVNDMNDINQFDIQEPGATSYKDEEIIKEWAESITSAYPIAAGGDVPASQTATTSAIQNTNAKTAYTLTKEAKGFFLRRWMDRHALPIIAEGTTAEDIIRIEGDDDNIKQIVERVVTKAAQTTLAEDFYSKGIIPTEMDIQLAIESAEKKLTGKDMFIKLVDKLMAEHVDTTIYFTNEELDTAVTVQNLMSLIPLAPEYREDTIKQIYDLLGLDQPRKGIQAPQQGVSPQGGVPSPMGIAPQTTQAITGPAAGING